MAASPRRRHCAPPAGPLDDEDLLSEILLRLPPLPSSLPRASVVSRRWHSLASDPRFSRRFRAHHRRHPPLLGYFVGDCHNFRFQPILDSPNRVPDGRFPFPIAVGDRFVPLGCRHGLILVLLPLQKQLLVWDPITGDQHRLGIPPGFDTETLFSAAVLRAVQEVHHFQVVLVRNSDVRPAQAVAYVYSSETGVWGIPITSEEFSDDLPDGISLVRSSAMIGGSLYWLVTGDFYGMLEFNLGRQSLDLIPMPWIHGGTGYGDILVVTVDGGLGFLTLSGFTAKLWKRKMNCDGGTSWVLRRTIAFDKILSINSENKREGSFILGFAEENNVVLLRTSIGIFTVQLESLQFKKLSQCNYWYSYYAFEAVYTADVNANKIEKEEEEGLLDFEEDVQGHIADQDADANGIEEEGKERFLDIEEDFQGYIADQGEDD